LISVGLRLDELIDRTHLLLISRDPSFGIGNVGEFVKLFGNHHKVVVQLPMRHRIVDLAFLRAAEPSDARRKLAVCPVLKNALAQPSNVEKSVLRRGNDVSKLSNYV
jgi:hypothetical protein